MRRSVRVGRVTIGGGAPVSVQSMTTTKTSDVERTVLQIKRLEEAGCEIVRVAVQDEEDAKAIRKIKEKVSIPVVADIQFDYKLAILSVKNGADKIRINPGNMSKERLRDVVSVAKEYGVPIRVGANVGSLKHRTSERWKDLAESALEEVRALEMEGFYDIVVSVKSSNVLETIRANEYIAERVDYPIHLGVTEAGVAETAVVKSSIAIGYLLLKGIGDTIRVSIAGDPVREVIVGKKILISLGLREGLEVIACPTCGRAEIDVEELAQKVESSLFHINRNLKVAVMGCVVNGIGEGKDADLGVAGLKDGAVIFVKGKIMEKVPKERVIDRLRFYIDELLKEVD
ncbi:MULTISPECIES: flavodoxin-dependent (E)-4-hydroxy-3-methylbut-2-enyl-diphosphate synthase [Thermotoga]|jgi:(E)-4-hydroxy-3-methylbut-2-enyl-diphosphate synthase|uniref:4-hydroxy-3-methylbut-2-en-1-yl diphosphate synthase (flavodoxin) n=1 Tax=Thermotoga neapolitana (strain ATCC 49049 / DSM 4359 / NBRC 107923 / NS-E) TaxID=309803 RepID=B9KA78_THENN|nr:MULTISPECIES: flavodoxin-dependent (E)-4-hydroxy-3-methylbut-2-enyl-diphosphate synthase [Thermotoga]MDK2786035.1 (E)-4-hydroxy-3-methylbut-2-enyl-diphosphate synthase [Thermotoga sp.]HBF10725.1 flavodoxin-dependent (E)-4-hydroxy-3-methylbut-2-enyl-diphosphate synthase [Thermotoga neapolitana]ACM23861.1 4-hydroxy-3-methylbut-2-en-1-yl diphosphate synthase [Thermotoga neapolitana DSM 4359]AJG39891.1 4-hydroxy-3-methylbut-2-en-1-yl diphosphate synthase [Thermotoga sp. RQ7]KFZ21054.1 4-hydroxy